MERTRGIPLQLAKDIRAACNEFVTNCGEKGDSPTLTQISRGLDELYLRLKHAGKWAHAPLPHANDNPNVHPTQVLVFVSAYRMFVELGFDYIQENKEEASPYAIVGFLNRVPEEVEEIKAELSGYLLRHCPTFRQVILKNLDQCTKYILTLKETLGIHGPRF